MYVQGEQRGQHPDHHDEPNVSSLNLSVTLHVLDPVTPYNENKQTASRTLHILDPVTPYNENKQTASRTLHVLDPVTPYNENKQTARRHEVHYKRTLMSGYSFVSCH